VCCIPRRWSQRQIDDPLHGGGRKPGLRVLSRVSPSTPSVMNRACHRHTMGFNLPDRHMISAGPQPSAVARMILAPHMLLRRAAIRDDRLKPMAIRLGDVHDFLLL
jgi:hypothetical protein